MFLISQDRKAGLTSRNSSASLRSDVLSSTASSTPANSSHSNSKTAIIVLGGGLTENGECPPHTQLRLNRAVEIYKQRRLTGGAVIIPLSGRYMYVCSM